MQIIEIDLCVCACVGVGVVFLNLTGLMIYILGLIIISFLGLMIYVVFWNSYSAFKDYVRLGWPHNVA